MKLSFLIVLVLSVQLLLAAAATSPPPPAPPLPPLNSYKLVLQWPNTYCLFETSPPCQLHPQSFTLHGLWPQGASGSLVFCPGGSDMDDETLEAYKADLTNFWPDLKNSDFADSKIFWRRQWNKHGKCSGLSPANYLTMVFNAVKQHDVQKILAKSGITPGHPTGHTPAQIGQAILKETNLNTEIECKTNDSKQYLFQIYFCLTPQGQFKSCRPRPYFIRCQLLQPVLMPLPPHSP